ncbi:MAG: type restriction enzyme subunit [Thermococcaceae archaeon]|nr:type restriction enzyme subunit [Thermococcaceae archaeon]
MKPFEFFKENNKVIANPNKIKLEIPHDWKIVKLGEVAKVGSGRKPPIQDRGDIPVYGKSVLGFTTKPMIKSGKVLIMSNFPRPFSPQVVEAPVWVTPGFLYIVPKGNAVVAEYLKLFLEFLGPDIILPSGSGVPRISARRLASLDIVLPPLEEQKAIVKIFQLFDEALETGEKTVDLINKLKKATIDTIFVNFLERYPRVKVGDVATLVKRSPSTSGAASFPVITAARVPSGTLYLRAEDVIGSDKTPKPRTLFKPGEILYVKQNPKLDRVVVSKFEGLATADIFVISVDRTKVLPEYLALILHSSEFLDYAERLSSGSVLPRISWGDLSNFQFPLPPLDIQKNVVSNIVKLDELERLKLTKFSLLQDLRSYLLHTLLTGKVRAHI